MKSYKQDPDNSNRLSISLSESNFNSSTDLRRRNPESYLIIGFDTEYQSRNSVSGLDNQLLSYQYCCSVIEVDSRHPIFEWSGIILPDSHETEDRLAIQEFVELAISDGISQFSALKIPRHIYLVAHFTRADIPGFTDFKEDSKLETNSIYKT